MWGWRKGDLLCIPFLQTGMPDFQAVVWCYCDSLSLSNWGLSDVAGWGSGKAGPARQTFLFLHLTFIVLLAVLLRGEAYCGITGIQLPQMWKQSRGKRWRVLSLSPNNAWEDDNRVEWQLRERTENGRPTQGSSNSYELLVLCNVGKAERKAPSQQK